MSYEMIVSLVGLLASISGISFSYVALRRTSKNDFKHEGKTEGVMFSDIGYIKACVDRVEKNLNAVDGRYLNIAERLAKLEESVSNITKRVDEFYIRE